jgi:hypothetical protein
MSSVGIATSRERGPFVIVRPDGRRSRRAFGSQYRAAEFAMMAYGVDYWPELFERGFTVQPVSHFACSSPQLT